MQLSNTESITNWATNQKVAKKEREEKHSVNEPKFTTEQKSDIVSKLLNSLSNTMDEFTEANKTVIDKNLYDAIVSLEEAKRSIVEII